MSTEPTKLWKRWTTTSPIDGEPHFPKPVYRFTEILKRVGDYIVTNPLTEAEYTKFKDAAKFWAWYHDKRVRIKKDRLGDGMCKVTVVLMAHHRHDPPAGKQSSFK